LQEAYLQIDTIERQEKQSKDERERELISKFRKTGEKPEGWTRALDYSLKKDDENRIKQEERIKETKDRMQKEINDKENKKAEEDLFSQHLSQSANKYIEKEKEVQAWKEKLRISDSGKDDAFNDALLEYINTLSDDNRRIEACHNIIKICSGIARQLQQVK